MEIFEVAAPEGGPSLALHGGAGGRVEELALDGRAPHAEGLLAAYRAGWEVLAAGGSALDAVCATVEVLENDPLFNAGRGAALTATGQAELDASVMTGSGLAGAVAASKYARNPVRLARTVMERTEHVMLVDPDVEFLGQHGLEVVERGYFITEPRRQQLERVLDGRAAAARHGTVGAVARDAGGRVAAATSTGGMVGQADGRVGDTPVVGAGVYARDNVVAISSTGHGEAFIRGVVAYDIAARIRYARADLAEAVRDTFEEELTQRGSTGGLIAIGGDGRIVVAHNSPAMFSARGTGPEPTLTT
ncbi:MAG TPA: isoaspartyl peptidase/L-asparaginase [Trebonia sp.]|jgi:beta-aspartyl-peptidase (threonine type)|nr:isoaspartyl peptidase/L-asparaginase [Trebonia sp.]